MDLRQSVLVITVIGLVLFTACSASRAVENAGGLPAPGGVDPIYKFAGGIALKGYDPVAYFDEAKPVQGSADFSYEWNGAKWLFASAENLNAFKQNPEKYAPQYGGYCSWAVSHGYTAKGDPEAWKIVDGKLYLNYDKDVRARWEKDIPNHISNGDANWPRFLKEKPEHNGE